MREVVGMTGVQPSLPPPTRSKSGLLNFQLLNARRDKARSSWSARFLRNVGTSSGCLTSASCQSASSSTDSGCPDLFSTTSQVFLAKSPCQSPTSPLQPPGGDASTGIISDRPICTVGHLTTPSSRVKTCDDANNASTAIATVKACVTVTDVPFMRSLVFMQEMLNAQTFAEFIRKKDIARIKLALREGRFDINTKDEVCNILIIKFNKGQNVFLCACVCVCVCMRACVCVCVCVCIYVYKYIFIFM